LGSKELKINKIEECLVCNNNSPLMSVIDNINLNITINHLLFLGFGLPVGAFVGAL
jgi:hypothetical protein